MLCENHSPALFQCAIRSLSRARATSRAIARRLVSAGRPVGNAGRSALMTSKLLLLDALASHPSATPGERDNAARAAAAIRAKQAAAPSPGDAAGPRSLCLAAYPSGRRCSRAAGLGGMCGKCTSRGAPVWSNPGICGARMKTGGVCESSARIGGRCEVHASLEERQALRRARAEASAQRHADWKRWASHGE